MSIYFDVLITVILISLATGFSGVFLVLSRRSLSSFALSHSTLVGVLIMYFITNNLNSPLLILGAAVSGLIIVWLVELISKSKYIHDDSALGIVYLFFFALGILLINWFASSTPLNAKSVIVGNISLVNFDRFIFNGTDWGPAFTWLVGIIFLINLIYFLTFYKELKIVVFDTEFANSVGINPSIINYSYMLLVSLTIVTIFRVTGVILVIGLMIIPVAIALLISNKLSQVIIISLLVSLVSTLSGFLISWELRTVEMSSIIVILLSLLFIMTLLFTIKKRKKGNSKITESGKKFAKIENSKVKGNKK